LICLAILICLEHSFWLTQQGSSPTQAFTEALDTYFKDKHMLVDQKLENHLILKETSDWFTTQHSPSHEERIEFRKIVLDNLFRKANPYFLYTFVADTMSLARPKLSV
jgi:hypothetical protein